MATFILFVLVLFLTPGPAVFLTISKTVRGGKKNGIVTGLGIALGDLIHTCASVLGLSAILMTSALAFEIVKYLCAAYLVYLGIITLIKRSKKSEKSFVKNVKTSGSFRQALFIELLNPKTSILIVLKTHFPSNRITLSLLIVLVILNRRYLQKCKYRRLVVGVAFPGRTPRPVSFSYYDELYNFPFSLTNSS
jgi:threonine/homoserine/homoserine lactone efflux protein